MGFATLRESIDAKNIGKTVGLVSSFVSAGSLSGPALAGVLFDLAGYSVTWGFLLFIIMSNIIMRLVMIEKPRKGAERCGAPGDPTQQLRTEQEGVNDTTTSLLSSTPTQSYSSTWYRGNNVNKESVSILSFYKIVLSQRRVIVSLGCYITHSSLLASYSTTIPTHVKRTFGWGSLPAGLVLTAQQAPNILLGPISGLVRDKVGTRFPTGIGFLLLAPLLWLLGAAD
jgi:MFS family permease